MSLFSITNKIELLQSKAAQKRLLFVMLFLSSFLYSLSCTNDTDDDFQTFLEKNDGTEWMLSNEELKVYIRVNNKETPNLEQWFYSNENNCFEYNANIFIPGDCQIKENSINQLIIQGDLFLSDYECMTFTIEGDKLRVDITLDEWQEETVYFTKSTIFLDNLETCVEVKNEFFRFYHSHTK